MAFDDNAETPFSDLWWLKTLTRKFSERPKPLGSKVSNSRRCEFTRADWYDMLWARLTGDTPLLHVNDRYAAATREFMRLTRTNFAATVVGAVQDRTALVGARSGEDSDADGDTTFRRFMEANGTFFADALTYAYTMSEGAVIIGDPQEGEQYATATAEDPRQVVWSADPVRPTKVRAALKLYRDDDLRAHVAHLFLPPNPDAPKGSDEAKYRVRVAYRGGLLFSGVRFSPTEWEWQDDLSGPLGDDVQDFGLPVVPLTNRWGLGEFEPVIDLLDRIHNDIADTLWTQKYQTFLQRALIGNLPSHDKAGNPIDYDDIFSADPGALWRMPKDSEIWESKQADLTGLLAIRKADLLELSATTQTPMFMFTPDATGQSAEGADVAREGSVNKARDRILRLTPAANRIARLALAYSNKAQDAKGEIQPMWAPVREYTLSQRSAAAVAGRNSGVPVRSILSDLWQFDPTTVARMESERATDLLLPPAPPVPPPATEPPTVTP